MRAYPLLAMVSLVLCCPVLCRVARAETPTMWTGFITDTHCGTHCQRTSDMKPDAQCVRECVRKGSKYGLWYGHHVYQLEPQSRARRFAAEEVRVTGRMENDVLHIATITSAPPAR